MTVGENRQASVEVLEALSRNISLLLVRYQSTRSLSDAEVRYLRNASRLIGDLFVALGGGTYASETFGLSQASGDEPDLSLMFALRAFSELDESTASEHVKSRLHEYADTIDKISKNRGTVESVAPLVQFFSKYNSAVSCL